jgi:membrane protein YdbS with pleckstrin-like domain
MTTTRSNLLRHRESTVWIAALIGIPAWIAHLTFVAAMVHFTDTHSGWEWTLHAATAITALATIAGMLVCFELWRAAGRSVSDPDTPDVTPPALSRFLGFFGLLVGATNLVLILVEGSYVVLVRHGA